MWSLQYLLRSAQELLSTLFGQKIWSEFPRHGKNWLQRTPLSEDQLLAAVQLYGRRKQTVQRVSWSTYTLEARAGNVIV